MSEPTQICRGFTDQQWKGLRELVRAGDESAWQCAVEVFERRIRERFLSSIEALERADPGPGADVEPHPGAPADCSHLPDVTGEQVVVPGFAIMALSCLLIETLQAFREIPPAPAPALDPGTFPNGPRMPPRSSTTELFRQFLRLPAFGDAFSDDGTAKSFVRGVRNGILHEAETREWVIWRNEPAEKIVERRGAGYALNRSAFVTALRSEFESYLTELRRAGSSKRERFLKKMDDLVNEC